MCYFAADQHDQSVSSAATERKNNAKAKSNCTFFFFFFFFVKSIYFLNVSSVSWKNCLFVIDFKFI